MKSSMVSHVLPPSNHFLTTAHANEHASRRRPLFVEPDVFHAPAVEDAVGHQAQVLDPGLPAGGDSRVKKHRADLCLGEDPLDLPNDVFALYWICLHRLLIDQLVEFGVAVSAIVPHRTAQVILKKHLVGVVDTALDRHCADSIVLARHLAVPARGIDKIQFGMI
jgi:hypothetical protein